MPPLDELLELEELELEDEDDELEDEELEDEEDELEEPPTTPPLPPCDSQVVRPIQLWLLSYPQPLSWLAHNA